MKNKYTRIGLFVGLFSFGFMGCEDLADPIVESLQLNRALTPTALEARIRNQTTIELTWNLREDADHYIVEFSEDSLAFANIIFTDEVTVDELPYQHTFAGETLYSARVKAIGTDGHEDSKWGAITVRTEPEQIFLPLPGENVEDTYATVVWSAGSEVTHLIINPGNIERTITDDEKAAGEATIEGLSGSTTYDVTLYNGNKRRGTVSFSTIQEANVFPGDGLDVVMANAADGAELVLAPGTYTFAGTITLNKSITISAQKPHLKPVLNVAFEVADGATHVTLNNIELDGTLLNTVFNLATVGVEYGSINLAGCVVHDYGRQLIYGNVEAKLGTLSVDDCIISNFTAGGGDFIDFRKAYVANVTLTNSTFNNSPSARDFIRLDAAASYTGTGLTSNVLIDHCTIYGLSNSKDRILYVRFVENTLTVKNTIFAATDAYFTNQASTSQPETENNNYFNADGFITDNYATDAKRDISGTHTTLDPGFADAASGNFAISNQTLIDNEIGDPRWRQ